MIHAEAQLLVAANYMCAGFERTMDAAAIRGEWS